jgi:hypothetical protein
VLLTHERPSPQRPLPLFQPDSNSSSRPWTAALFSEAEREGDNCRASEAASETGDSEGAGRCAAAIRNCCNGPWEHYRRAANGRGRRNSG